MSDAYIEGFIKTALALNVKNPVGLLNQARGMLSRANTAVRARVGDAPVNAVSDAGREFMRGRTALLPLAATPLFFT